MLTCIPGIGRTIANYLADNYSIREMSNMTVEELSNINIKERKLGKKAYNIHKALTEK